MKWGKTRGTAGILAVPHYLITKIIHFSAKSKSGLTIVDKMFHKLSLEDSPRRVHTPSILN
jgi:hypothetical protein